jgi:signal transduction histidine kinase
MITSLQRRLWLAAALPVVSLVVLGLLLLQGAFTDTVERTFDARLDRTLGTLVGGLQATPDGRVVVRRPLGHASFDAVGSGWHWQVATSDGVALRSRSLWDRELPMPLARADGRVRYLDIEDATGKPLRAAVRRIELPGTALPLTVLLTGPREDIEREVADFVRLSGLAASGLVALALAAVAAQLWLGLAPLRRFSAHVAELAAGRREALDRVRVLELDAAIDELNQVLDQNRRLAESGRKLAGDLAHAIKTPLAVLRMRVTADASVEREAIARIDDVVDRHLARASADARRRATRCDAAVEAERIAGLLHRLHPDKRLRLAARGAGLQVACEASDLQEMLGNLLDNALRAAHGDVALLVAREGLAIVFTLEDDGRGLEDDAIARLGERGLRFDESMPGTGLGVSISRDIAESYGGRLAFERRGADGLRARLWLPAWSPRGARGLQNTARRDSSA